MALCACSDTHQVERDVCGNRIVEKNEDCDGQVNCSAECHFECGKDKACPAGWGCDLGAGVCHAAQGLFGDPVPVGESFSPPIVRDFDADGRDDLVLTGALFRPLPASLLYFDASAQLERRVTLPSAMVGSAADVTGDARADLILSGDTVTAFQAEKSRRLTPLIGAARDVASDAQLFAIDADCNGMRDFVLFEGKTLTNVSSSEAQELGQTQLSSTDLGRLERASHTQGLRTLHAVGPAAAGGSGPCEMLALPSSSSTIAIYAPVLDSGWELKLLSTVTHGVKAAGRLFLADVDGDKLTDLVISGDSTEVSYGTGDGTFRSEPPNSGPTPPAGAPDQKTVTFGDPTLAVVNSFGGPVLYSEIDGGYTDARSLDLSGDGVPDLVGVRSSRSIEIERSHPSGRTSLLTLATSGIPHLEDVGDFDGDGKNDLLLLEDTPGSELISVLFAPANDASGGPTVLAELSQVRQLAAGSVATNYDEDANSDIGVLYDVDGTTKLGFLMGGADRLLRSEVPPPSNDYSVAAIPVLGHFRDESTIDLALFDMTLGGFESTVVSGAGGDAGIGPSPAFGGEGGGVSDPGFSPPTSKLRAALLSIGPTGTNRLESAPDLGQYVPYAALAADLDRDGIDEVYLRDADGVLAFRHGAAGFAAERVLTTSNVWKSLGRADTNLDGAPDVFVIDSENKALVVLQAASHGPKEHHLVFDDCADQMVAAAFIQADQDPEPEVMINCASLQASTEESPAFLPYDDTTIGTPSGLFLCDVDWEHDRLVLQHAFQGLRSLHLESGDFDGNGVQDLAADGSESLIMFGTAK